MNLKQYSYVQTLARTMSFTRAADELGITQPSLSQAIKKLETEVGSPLFLRNGQDIRLTDAGAAYLEMGRQVQEIEHRFQCRLMDLAEQKTGTLVVGASPYRSEGMLPEVVKKFHETCPGVRVLVDEHGTAELLEACEHGKYDLCLMLLPVNEHIFHYETVMEEELLLAVPAAYPPLEAKPVKGRRYPAIRPEQLQGARFVMTTRGQVMQQELENLCADQGLQLEQAAVVKSLSALIAMVRAGVGMALVPAGIERFCPEGSVTFYSFRQMLPRRQLAAIWPKNRPLSAMARALLEDMKSISW